VLLLQTGAVAPLARQAQTDRAAAPERPRRQRVPRIRSPASSRSSYSASESSGPECWRFPCWPAVPPMRWPTPSDGATAWPDASNRKTVLLNYRYIDHDRRRHWVRPHRSHQRVLPECSHQRGRLCPIMELIMFMTVNAKIMGKFVISI
jgi:hypothetical protein